jgi:hypothetical protein
MVPPLGVDLAIAAMVIGLALLGRRHGLFVSTLVGLQILASFVVAISASLVVGDMLRANGVESTIALWVAVTIYAVTFVASVIGIRMAMGAWVPEMAVPLSPWLDTMGGAAIGAMSGWLLAGVVLVAWSMASLPAPWRFQPNTRSVDPGDWVLRTFARCIDLDKNKKLRPIMLDGEAATAGLEGPPYSSEPFIDSNGNGLYDVDEPYYDVNRDGAFTSRQSFADINENGRRDLGLIELYKLGTWGGVTVWHAPRITSPDRVELPEPPEAGDVIYQATADDADGREGLLFTIRSTGADKLAAVMLEIDEQTGETVLVQPPTDRFTQVVKFTVVVTDLTGLTDELLVRVVW